MSILMLGAPFSMGQETEVVVTTGHTTMINRLAVSNDGRFLVSCDVDKQVKIWEVGTGREFRTLSGFDGRINQVYFAADNISILLLLNSGTLEFWNILTGEKQASFACRENSEDLTFLPNLKKAAFIDEDNAINLVNPYEPENVTVLETDYPTSMVMGPTGNRLYYTTVKGELAVLSLPSGTLLSKRLIWDEYKHPVTPPKVDPSGKYLAIAFNDDGEKVRFYNASTLQEEFVLDHKGGRIQDMEFTADGTSFIITDHKNNLSAWNYRKGKMKWKHTDAVFSRSTFALYPDGKTLIAAEAKEMHLHNVRSGKKLRTLNAPGNAIVSMAYDPTDHFIAVATLDIKIKLWSLTQGRITGTLDGFFPIEFTPDGKQLISMKNAMELAVWNPYTGEQLSTLATEYELIQHLAVSRDGKYVAGAGFMGIVKIWELESGKLIKKLTGHDGGIYGLSFHPDGKRLASCGMDNTIRIWDWEAEKELLQTDGGIVLTSALDFSEDGKQLVSCNWDKSVTIWDTESLAPLQQLEGHQNMVTTVDFSSDNTLVVSGAGNNAVAAADNTVRLWRSADGSPMCVLGEHRDRLINAQFSADNTLVYSAGNDGFTRIWDVATCTEKAALIGVYLDDYVIVTPDNYYTASKDALQGVSFRVGDQLFPFEQFDLKLNRPDIVAERIGKAPQALIDAYYKAYLKRLNKMGFDESMLGNDFHLPNAKILSEQLPLTTSQDILEFKAEFWDTKYPLNRVNVYVNDVPVYGIEGIDLSASKNQRTTLDIKAPLIPGINKVQVSVLNQQGVESFRQTHEVIHEIEHTTGDLHIIAIGVSDYKEDRFKLDFAAKDARDFIALLEQSSDLYNKVHVKEITDSLATIENIMALQPYLESTNPEDVVLVFFAGHGMLSRDMEYFFGTYDISFRKPLDRGLSYSKIESLFNTTTALRKLLIMDTCHSGEVDEDEDEKTGGEGTSRNVTTKTFARDVQDKEANLGLNNSFELMQSLFSDIRRGTGATVISSAGGAEYAYESEDWSNGLFTYCMLNGLGSGDADLNNDNTIHISELREYVNQKVSALSGGKQNPTYRNENLSMDFALWHIGN